MTHDHVPTAHDTTYLRRYARALTGCWSAATTLCSFAVDAMQAANPVRSTGATPPELYRALSEIWNSPTGHCIEKTALKNQHLLGPEQRRVAAMPRREREVFLLTTLAALSIRDAAKATSLTEAEARFHLQAADAATSDADRARVLIIEDEVLIARDLERIVQKLGHIVVGKARSRAAALDCLPSARPTLVLADMQLIDGGSGVDAANDIIDLVGNIPIIFVTAYPGSLIGAHRPEPTFLVNKPFTPTDVRSAITQVLYFGVKSARAVEQSNVDGPPLVCFTH